MRSSGSISLGNDSARSQMADTEAHRTSWLKSSSLWSKLSTTSLATDGSELLPQRRKDAPHLHISTLTAVHLSLNRFRNCWR